MPSSRERRERAGAREVAVDQRLEHGQRQRVQVEPGGRARITAPVCGPPRQPVCPALRPTGHARHRGAAPEVRRAVSPALVHQRRRRRRARPRRGRASPCCPAPPRRPPPRRSCRTTPAASCSSTTAASWREDGDALGRRLRRRDRLEGGRQRREHRGRGRPAAAARRVRAQRPVPAAADRHQPAGAGRRRAGPRQDRRRPAARRRAGPAADPARAAPEPGAAAAAPARRGGLGRRAARRGRPGAGAARRTAAVARRRPATSARCRAARRARARPGAALRRRRPHARRGCWRSSSSTAATCRPGCPTAPCGWSPPRSPQVDGVQPARAVRPGAGGGGARARTERPRAAPRWTRCCPARSAATRTGRVAVAGPGRRLRPGPARADPRGASTLLVTTLDLQRGLRPLDTHRASPPTASSSTPRRTGSTSRPAAGAPPRRQPVDDRPGRRAAPRRRRHHRAARLRHDRAPTAPRTPGTGSVARLRPRPVGAVVVRGSPARGDHQRAAVGRRRAELVQRRRCSPSATDGLVAGRPGRRPRARASGSTRCATSATWRRS